MTRRNLAAGVAAAMGRPRDPEALAAEQHFDRATVRRVRRLVRRGGTADTPAQARLAVALARERRRDLRTLEGRVMVILLVLLSVQFLAVGAWLTLRPHDRLIGVVGVLLGLGGLATVLAAPPWRRLAERAERANLRLLCDQPPEPHTAEQHPPTGLHLAAPVMLLLTWYVLGYGLIDTLIDHQAVTLAHLLTHGTLFGVLMTLFNLTVARRLTRHAQRP